ncbi:MAG: ADOP family duplicated permease [Longimicrobiales bacterium]
MVDTAADVVADRVDSGRWAEARELVAEWVALLVAGLRLRGEDLSTGAATWSVGWTRDVRFAVRTLLRAPSFTAVVVLTLGLGIGANAAVFALVDGVLLRPPPYEDPDDLVLVWNAIPESGERIAVAGPDAAEIETSVESFGSVGFALRTLDGALEGADGAEARHVRLAAATPDFFATLGVEPALGRGFADDDARDAAGPEASTVLVSHDLWAAALNADPDVVGRTLRLNGRPAVVAGVLPRDFTLLLPPDAGMATDVDVWVPLRVPLSTLHRTEGRLLDQDSDNTGAVVARLAPGTSLAQARAELDALAARLRSEVPFYAESGLGFDVRPLRDDATAHARPVLLALMAGVAGVLLVACLNIATLMMVRSAGRRAEFAVRTSLGAGRARLVRQLLVESVVLVGLGLAAAVVLARGALAVFAARVPATLAPPEPLALEPRTLAFMAALAGGAAVVFGLLPALGRTASASPGHRLRGRPRSRGQGVLVAAEVALSVVLVVGAGLLVRTVDALAATDPGFEAQGALAFHVSLRVPDRYRSPADRARYAEDVQRRIEALPGVGAVGWVGVLPLSGQRWIQPYGLPGQAESEWRSNRADFRVASSGYFEAVGARLLEGRAFTPDEDRNERERVVVVDEALARRIAPSGSALGSVVGIPLDGAAVEARVVGVVGTIRQDRLDADGREAIYVPYRQEASRDVAFVVRTEGDPVRLIPDVRAAVRAVDPGVPAYELRTLTSYVDEAMAPRRFALSLLLGFAALALLCAAVGLYGVVAFDASRRTRDLGLRMAVGAGRRDVLRSVLATALRPGAAGLAAGVVLAAAVSGGFRSLLYGIGALDPLTWAVSVAVVAAVAAVASGVPAWRASRLSPVEALRSE